MIHASTLSKRVSSLFTAGVLATAALVPLLLSGNANAFAQLDNRQITIETSEKGATDVVYSVSFDVATTGPIQAIIIDICDSPLLGTTCLTADGASGFDSNEVALTVNTVVGLVNSAWSVDQTESTANKIVIKDDVPSATNVTAATTVSFDLGSNSADGVVNPTSTLAQSVAAQDSFYARMTTYAVTTDADAYDSTITGATNPPSTAVDGGGIAMSTADQLTINARVQEVLQFCVGTDDATTNSDCRDITGTTVDLGVIQSGTPSISPVATTSGGNNKNGLAMIRTNAVNGVVVDYFAELVTGDGGAVHLASLRVSGSTCTGTGALAGGDKVDQCFNSAGTTRIAFGAADEGFGMTASSVDTTNGSTTNLDVDDEYSGDGTNAARTGATGGGWSWSEGVTDRIASSTAASVKVVDDEMLILRFAAQAAVTTPTGQYGVTSTYIATASY